MCQENLFSVYEVRLNVITVVVTVFVKEGPYVLFDARPIVGQVVRRQFKGNLVPDIHELLELVLPRILKVESCNFLKTNKGKLISAYKLT